MNNTDNYLVNHVPEELTLHDDLFSTTSMRVSKYEETGIMLELFDLARTKEPFMISLDKEKTDQLISFLTANVDNAEL
ncbi:TPA: hypothetical protein LP521_001452 [Enterococcus faecium]|nr:hypothetical protein [Enterococcus faecium]